MLKHLSVILWRCIAILSLAIGALGIPLPGLPTVPFILLAAWAGSRGWPTLEERLLSHPRYGPAVKNWREHRAISRRAKWLATCMMLLSSTVLFVSNAPTVMQVIIPGFLLCVATWLWRRPEAAR